MPKQNLNNIPEKMEGGNNENIYIIKFSQLEELWIETRDNIMEDC